MEFKVGDFVKSKSGHKGEIEEFDTKGINTCATFKDRTRWLITELTKIKR